MGGGWSGGVSGRGIGQQQMVEMVDVGEGGCNGVEK